MFASPDPHRPARTRPWAFDQPLLDDEWGGGQGPFAPDDYEPMLAELGSYLDDAPLRFLTYACGATMQCAIERAMFVSSAQPEWPREFRALAVAAQWLANAPAITAMGADIPAWLAGLDETEVTGARRHRDQQTGGTTYLVEVGMAGGHLGCIEIHAGSGGEGAITHAFPIDLPLERLEEVASLATAGKRARYRTINAATARRELVVAFGLYHAAPAPHLYPFNVWPRIESLIALTLRWLAEASSGQHKGAA